MRCYEQSIKLNKDDKVEKKMLALKDRLTSISNQQRQQEKIADELRLKAISSWRRGEFAKAIQQIQKAARNAPDSAKIEKTLKAMEHQKKYLDNNLKEAEHLIKNGKLKKAQKILNHISKVDAKYKRYKNAIKQLKDAKKRVNNKHRYIEKLLKEAILLKNSGQLSKAEILLKEGRKQFPKNRDINILLKKIVRQQNNAIRKMQIVETQWGKGYLEKAMHTTKEALMIDPSNKQIAKTLKDIESLKKTMDDSLNKANRFINQNKFKQAQSMLKIAKVINKKYPPYIKTERRLNIAKKKAELNKKQNATLRLNKTVFYPKEKIVVRFTAPYGYASNAWIGIIPSRVSHGSEYRNDKYDVSSTYLKKKTAGTFIFKAPAKPGYYDFRMHNKDTGRNGKEVAYISFRVIQGVHRRKGKVLSNTQTSTTYTPNSRGDVFKGGYWAGSKGGSDWIQRNFGRVIPISRITIAEASTDVTTRGFRLILKLKKPNGRWVAVDELRNTNINRVNLSGGAKGHSIPSYVKRILPPVKATAFRLEFYGHGWFDASDIRFYTPKKKSGKVMSRKLPWTGTYRYDLNDRKGSMSVVLSLRQHGNSLTGTIHARAVSAREKDLNFDIRKKVAGTCAGNKGKIIMEGQPPDKAVLYDSGRKLALYDQEDKKKYVLQRVK